MKVKDEEREEGFLMVARYWKWTSGCRSTVTACEGTLIAGSEKPARKYMQSQARSDEDLKMCFSI